LLFWCCRCCCCCSCCCSCFFVLFSFIDAHITSTLKGGNDECDDWREIIEKYSDKKDNLKEVEEKFLGLMKDYETNIVLYHTMMMMGRGIGSKKRMS
jgi:hypothetical protein